MKHKTIWMLVSMLMVLGLLVGGFGCAPEVAPTTPTTPTTPTVPTTPVAPTEPEVIKWVMEAKEPSAPAYGHWARPDALQHWMLHAPMDRGWAEWILDLTDGRLEVTVVEANSIYPLHEAVENVGAGVTEACAVAPGYLAGTIPECYVGTGISMMWPDARYAFDCFYNYGLLDKWQPAFAAHNVYLIPTFNSEVGGFGATFACTDMASIEGKKIRFFGAHGKFVEALGGLPVDMAYADVYMGLKLGTIDGTTTGGLALETGKLKEVVMGWATMGLYGCTVNSAIFNMDALNALPDDIEKLVKEQSKYYFAATLGMVELLQQEYLIAASVRDYGIEHWVWSPEEQKKAREIAKDEVWSFYGAKTPLSQEMLDIIIEYQKVFGLL